MYKVVFYRYTIKQLTGRRSLVWLKGLSMLLITAVRSGIHSSSSKQPFSSCWEEDAAVCSCAGSLAPRAAGKGPACGNRCFSHLSEKPCDSGQLGRMWFLPLFSSTHEPFELGVEVTQPALLPGRCSGSPRGSDSGVQSCLPRCCQGQSLSSVTARS